MSLQKDLAFLILQYCKEENLKRTAHIFEQETGYFFDLKYFNDLLLDGKWEDAEDYLSSFTAVLDNKHSTKIYFEIRKQKFLEALEKHEPAEALDILLKDLKVFAEGNEELYKEMAQLFALDDFRQHKPLALYRDELSARKSMVKELRIIIEKNPALEGKLHFPEFDKSRLSRMINQSLNWQHILCGNPSPQPQINSLLVDHNCPGGDRKQAKTYEKESALLPNFVTMPLSSFLAGSTSNQSSVNLLNKDCQNCSSTSEVKPIKPLDEVEAFPEEFPRAVERILDIVSCPTSLDFHPVHQALLLVGNSNGDIAIWDVTCSDQLCKGNFYVWNENSSSDKLHKKKNHGITVKRVLWSPDGSLFGVAYSQRLIHLYWYEVDGNYSEKQLEIDAHEGSVNDLAFSRPHDDLLVISCGDDKLIQVWDAETGSKKYTFDGHETPVYSICPHMKENVHFIFSISTSGEIKAWLFDDMGPRVCYDAPDSSCMRMAYSTDGKRLFSCGTNKDGESHIVEWNESEGFVVRSYNGLCKTTSALVEFDTTNQFLAAGDEHLIKIWDIDHADMLAVIDADGGLPVSPYFRFNKNGTLLAVCAEQNKIRILVNDKGHELLKNPPFDSTGRLTASFRNLGVNPIPAPFKAEVVERRHFALEESLANFGNLNIRGPEYYRMEKSNVPGIYKISRCQSVLFSSDVKSNLVRRMVYTNAGNGILALTEDGTHQLWKWAQEDTNPDGEANAKHAPHLWSPISQVLMVNSLPGRSSGIVSPCFSLSRNDAYLISTSGKMITLYNTLAFKNMRNIMPSPPAATCILFYPPDNNIIIIGMDDSSILVYHILEDKMIRKLEGHSKRISGLAYSTKLNILISSGVDAQIYSWDSMTWERKRSVVSQTSVNGWFCSEVSELTVELDKDEQHFLAVHETQLAIYETSTLLRVKQWVIANFGTKISNAKYSCDAQLVYAAMRNGIISIFAASDLTPRFEINPSVYLPSQLVSSNVYPIVVAAHPKKPNQFAIGLSDGKVAVLEPVESEGKWSALPLSSNDASSRL